MPINKNEAFSRVIIDAQLADQGWNTQDQNSVRYEVFVEDGTRADYVLCDRHGRSMAVIEAKRFSISPGDATEQAKGYRLCGHGRQRGFTNHGYSKASLNWIWRRPSRRLEPMARRRPWPSIQNFAASEHSSPSRALVGEGWRSE